MDGKTALYIMSTVHVVCCMFHDPPSIRISPKTFNNQSDFGFSMAYQDTSHRLVVGAPSEDLQGKVYSCDMENLIRTTELSCDENNIDLEKLNVKYSRDANPEQKFYLGASIAVTSDYLFTCAPLTTMDLFKNDNATDVYGTCIAYNTTDGTAHKYKGTTDEYRARTVDELKSNQGDSRKLAENIKGTLSGGIGWSTLIDQANDLLLIVKSSLLGNFYYTKMSKPLEQITLVSSDKASRNILRQYRNIGFAITAVKFLSKDSPVYAFSVMAHSNQASGIAFLRLLPPVVRPRRERRLNLLNINKNTAFTIEEDNFGSMFGMALGAADLNRDGFEDLLVGAPAYSDEETVECGALHIYLGGASLNRLKMKRNNRMRTIMGVKDGARFGSTIAVQDMDGDGISEIIVSAPYEDNIGAVYVLSGFEIQETLMKFNTYKMIMIHDLKLTQRIVREHTARFGFSLQFVSDFDENGCNELAVGELSADAGGAVELYNCIQSVNVTMVLEPIGEATLKTDTLIMKVCAQVVYPKKPNAVVGELKIMNNITGEGAYVTMPEFTKDLSCVSCTEKWFCEEVTIVFKNTEGAYYQFTTQAQITPTHNKEFNGSQVTTSSHSQLTNSSQISRFCEGDDCQPDLSMEIEWFNRDPRDPYVLGSSVSEMVMISVINEGNSSYDSCVRVRVHGAAASLLCAPDRDMHLCDFPKPLRRFKKHSINMILDMSQPTNYEADKLLVEAELYEKCHQGKPTQTKNFIIQYSLSTNGVYLEEGMSYSRQVTDKDIMDSKHSVYGIQEYVVTNIGSISWYNISAVISMEKKPFIVSYESSSKCDRTETQNKVLFSCTMELLRNTTRKVIVTQKINKTNIESHLKDDMLNITSQLSLYFQQTNETKIKSETSTLTFQRDVTLLNNKWLIILIAAIVAAVLLMILITVLFRYGFFKRKQKERLEEFRESVRRRSSRRTLSGPNGGHAEVIEEGLQIDYDSDSAFEEDANNADKGDADKIDAGKIDAGKIDADKIDAEEVSAGKRHSLADSIEMYLNANVKENIFNKSTTN